MDLGRVPRKHDEPCRGPLGIKGRGEEVFSPPGIRPTAKSKLGEALTYACNQREKIEAILTDGRYELDTNLVENAIRITMLGAKNYLFFGSAEAGKQKTPSSTPCWRTAKSTASSPSSTSAKPSKRATASTPTHRRKRSPP